MIELTLSTEAVADLLIRMVQLEWPTTESDRVRYFGGASTMSCKRKTREPATGHSHEGVATSADTVILPGWTDTAPAIQARADQR